jgi:hypothetical protein
MKVAILILSVALIFSSVAHAVTVSYDTVYDAPGRSLSTVACSDGANGLLTRGFTTFGSLPNFPDIGGASAVAGWNSPNCGTCWQLTYTNSTGEKKSINILAVDVGAGFNIALAAMNELTGGKAVQFGRVDVASEQVNASVCGL